MSEDNIYTYNDKYYVEYITKMKPPTEDFQDFEREYDQFINDLFNEFFPEKEMSKDFRISIVELGTYLLCENDELLEYSKQYREYYKKRYNHYLSILYALKEDFIFTIKLKLNKNIIQYNIHRCEIALSNLEKKRASKLDRIWYVFNPVVILLDEMETEKQIQIKFFYKLFCELLFDDFRKNSKKESKLKDKIKTQINRAHDWFNIHTY